mgnify:CR=1 FL=1
MLENFIQNIHTYFQKNIVEYIHELYEHPIRLILWIIDITIVLYLIYKFIKSSKKTRAWQLIKGIALYLIITAISSLLNLRILNYILTFDSHVYLQS